MSEDRTKQPVAPANVDPMDLRRAFGQKLREAREKVGYTIEELAYATKIMPSFIENLEVGEFDKLPGEVFIRGFVKSMCKSLNENPEAMLQLIEQSYGLRKERLLVVPGSPGASRVRIGSERPERRFNINLDFIKELAPLVNNRKVGYVLAAVAGFVILVSIGVGLSSIIRSNSAKVAETKSEPVELHISGETGANDAPADPTKEQAAVAEDASEPNKDAPKSGEDAKQKEEVTVIAAQPQGGAEGLAPAIPSEQLLELKVKEAVNIRINIDKRGWETARYEPETYKIKFKDDVNILVFDAAAVDISFNGKSIGSLGSKGRVRRLSFVAQTPSLDEKQNF